MIGCRCFGFRHVGARGAEGEWNRLGLRMKSRSIRRHAGGKPRVLYVWHPELWPYVDYLKPDVTVYHLYDLNREYVDGESCPRQVRLFRRACAEADIVLAGTAEQAEQMPSAAVRLLPNGVNCEWYGKSLCEPTDMAAIPRPRIGYVGTISEKLDLSWLERLANNGSWHIVLAGPVRLFEASAKARWQKLISRANVHYLGSKKSEVVPDYMRSLDVGLMNYVRGIHMEVASPLKLYEYCAAGLPIVASRLDSLVCCADAKRFVRFADSAGESIEVVAECLARPLNEAERQQRRDFAEANSWRVRAKTVFDLITTHLTGTESRPNATVAACST